MAALVRSVSQHLWGYVLVLGLVPGVVGQVVKAAR